MMFKKNNLNKIIFSLFLLVQFFLWNFLFADYLVNANDMSVFLLWWHKSISNNVFDSSNNIDKEWILYILKDIKDHSAISIVSLLEFSPVKQIVLDNYLEKTSILLDKVWFIKTDLKQDILLLESDMNDCIIEKDLYDDQFFESIDLYDQNYMNDSLEKSISAQKCIWENRIKMNAKKILFDEFNYYYDFVILKYQYLQSKKDLIIRNFDFMKNGLLDELVSTKEILNTLGN